MKAKKVTGNLSEYLEDIEYENGSGDKRALGVSWHDNLGLVNLSFYDFPTGNELVFAEDFELRTAIELRNRLTQMIEGAA